MKKNMVKYLAALLLCTVIAAGAVVPMQRGEGDRSDWMAELDDTAALNEITIPGTHDSGALHSIAEISGKCQSLSIGEQLKIGVRFLDIRLRLVDNELRVVHSFTDQMTDFEDAAEEMAEFIRENESEFLLVSIKEDADPIRSDRDFAEAAEETLLAYPQVSRACELPETVGDARGAIHILARYRGATVGLPCYSGWQDDESFELDSVYIQDNYRVASAEEKIADIRQTYSVAETGGYDLVLNYTSCYLETCFPPIYAGLPAHSINRDTLSSMSDREEVGALGVLVCAGGFGNRSSLALTDG